MNRKTPKPPPGPPPPTNTMDQPGLPTSGIVSSIDQLPVWTVEPGAPVSKCSICLEPIVHDTVPSSQSGGSRSTPGQGECMGFPCGHVFHAVCARQWLRIRPVCPNCNCQVLSQVVDPQVSSQDREYGECRGCGRRFRRVECSLYFISFF